VKGIRRLAILLSVALLVAAIPVSAFASEGILRSSVGQAKIQFEQDLTHDIATGLDPIKADQLMWRFTQITTTPVGTWWQAPVNQHKQLTQLSQLQSDLEAGYAQSLSERRDGFLRALHNWTVLFSQAGAAGIAVEDLQDTRSRFEAYAAMARTPAEYQATTDVLGAEMDLLLKRMASFRSARDGAQAALDAAQASLARAGQYPQLNVSGFRAQVNAAAGDMASAHTADAYSAIRSRLQKTNIAIQSLLNARANAFSLLSSAQSVLGTARSVGAPLGNAPATISSLAARLNVVGDVGSFQSISSQLADVRQMLQSAIWAKQMQLIAGNLGAGKVIVVSLSRQVLTAYQDGTAVLTTYVATGRPQLPTPPGVYHIFHRYSPYQMISPWPYGSPYWYPSSWVNWAMEFRGGGYFLHDAPWRSTWGPGANLYNGTHGCVNVPYNPMKFLWGWAPIGTTVIVQY
jgi:hypothetical protein